MESSIAVVGENLVDLLVDADGSVTAVLGGGPFNVARTVARLGFPALFCSGVSSDAFGERIAQTLREESIDLALQAPSDLPTTMAVVNMSRATPSYHFHLNNTAAFTIPTDFRFSPSLELGALYFGTLGLVVEPMASVGELLVHDASDATLVVLDPNCRPSAITDHTAFRERLSRLYPRADVVKVSTEDLDYLAPGEDYLDAARSIVRAGTRCVLVTDGPDPLRVVTQTSVLSIPVAPTDVVDTVGAGDALVGGFVAWWIGHALSRGDLDDETQLECAVNAAIEISRRTCMRQGAEPPTADDVRALETWDWL